MDDRAIEFLQRLLDAPGPSGYEEAPARVWRAEAESFADEVTLDVAGNSYALVRARNPTPETPAVIFAGHIDEIGFVITHVDPEGYLWFDPVGGWDAPVAVGQRIRIAGRNGDVIGVVGKKAIHIMPPEERDKPVKLNDLWIDIGAGSRAEAKEMVDVGDSAVIDARFVRLAGDRCAARSMDNRVGAFVALEAARLLAGQRGDVDVYAIATTREEISFAGAMTAAYRTRPIAAVAIDVTHATDYPGADKKRDDEVSLGGGPVLSRGAAVNPKVFEALRDAAARLDIACPIQASGRHTGTDADPISAAGPGTAAGLISLPNRYMHSPNETISLSDLEQASRVLAEFARSVLPDADFRPT